MLHIAQLWRLIVMISTVGNEDAALVARRQEAMEAARMKMQQELDAKAEIFREKQRQVQ